jgi:H+/Cl- antiporter ClcA
MKKYWTVLLIVLGILSIIISIIYFTHTAGNLPSFFLGYAKNSSHKHMKHAIAFLSLGIILLIGAWISSGGDHKSVDTPKNSKEDRSIQD